MSFKTASSFVQNSLERASFKSSNFKFFNNSDHSSRTSQVAISYSYFLAFFNSSSNSFTLIHKLKAIFL